LRSITVVILVARSVAAAYYGDPVPMKLSKIIRLLEQDGWVLNRTAGRTGTSPTQSSLGWLLSQVNRALP